MLNVEPSGTLDARHMHEPNRHRIRDVHEESLQAWPSHGRRCQPAPDITHTAPPRPTPAVMRVIHGSWGGVIKAGSDGVVEVVDDVGEEFGPDGRKGSCPD